MTEPIRIANCSGFFGDRPTAAREMLDGGPIDVLTGDWLAELTMYILHKTRERSGGFARTFVEQMRDVLPECLDRGITVVSNAGGLDPRACAEAVRSLAAVANCHPRIAVVTGDDITARLAELAAAGETFANLDTGEALDDPGALVTANAYLGAAPIAHAIAAGAQVIITGRVTDASIVVGPAMAHFGWGPDDLDEVAGAVVAGHIIECGAQCCGGNYAFFEEIPGADRIGFPIAEIAADGSAVITKHPGTGGAVTVGTVTAQLLYEIGGPRYLSPDAVPLFDSIILRQAGLDRVAVSGVKGESPPSTLKVTANRADGWRNSMTMVLTGANIEAKARAAEAAVWAEMGPGLDHLDAHTSQLFGDLDASSAHPIALLRLAVSGADRDLVGRAFSGAVVATSLSTYPGTFFTSAPTSATEVARYWPTTVDRTAVAANVELDGEVIASEPWRPQPRHYQGPHRVGVEAIDLMPAPTSTGGPLSPVALGTLLGARSGDKGGHANLGLWADDPEVATWLLTRFDIDALRSILPEADGLEIERYPFANLAAVNFIIRGYLGYGVASNLELDTQAKGLGELVRSRRVDVPAALLERPAVAKRLEQWR